MIQNIFDKNIVLELQQRFNKLQPGSVPLWGKMDAAQMLAHCCVTYELIYDNNHPKPGAIKRWLMRMLIKPIVTGEKTYPRSSRTAPEFMISGSKDFDKEKSRLFGYMDRTASIGKKDFENKESHSFGRLTASEWNNMMYKHLDHHLQQFGV